MADGSSGTGTFARALFAFAAPERDGFGATGCNGVNCD